MHPPTTLSRHKLSANTGSPIGVGEIYVCERHAHGPGHRVLEHLTDTSTHVFGHMLSLIQHSIAQGAPWSLLPLSLCATMQEGSLPIGFLVGVGRYGVLSCIALKRTHDRMHVVKSANPPEAVHAHS